MKPIQSIDDIRRIWHEEGAQRAMSSSESFFRQATQQKRQDVEDFLLEVSKGNYGAVSRLALSWLGEYRDPRLLPLLIEFLQNVSLQLETIHLLSMWIHEGIIQAGDPRVIKPLMNLLTMNGDEIPKEYLIDVLCKLEAIEDLDAIVAFLNYPDPTVRRIAASCVIKLGKIAAREDVIDSAVRLLEDPEPIVRGTVALFLKEYYPNKYSSLHPKDYFPDNDS
jgi:HEAT repeat protein